MSRRPNQPARRAQSRRLNFEPLEGRELLTGFMVTSAADNGSNASPTAGSLRAAIIAADADTSVGGDTISFALPAGVQTIALPTSLPAITRQVAIDATSSAADTPLVVIDGSAAGAGASGLTFSAGNGSVVRGLSIVGFGTSAGAGGAAIDIQAGSSQDLIEDDYLGIGADGNTARANTYGVVVASSGNTIGGATNSSANVISGNTYAGVLFISAATGNVVEANLIGTNAAGSTGVGNLYGVVLAASGNTIGGVTLGSGNLISGNIGPKGQTGIGVLFTGASTANLVEGNSIGTNASGTAVLPTAQPFSNVYGIYFGTPGGSTADNISQDTIGGTVQGAGNLISGNFIGITGNVVASLIAGNSIGLNASRNAAIPNGDGFLLGATGTTIGGTTAGAGNIVSASGMPGADGTGINLTGDSDLIQGNIVGQFVDGSSTVAGNVIGMALQLSNSTIGGTTVGAGNVIAANSSDGITLDASTVSSDGTVVTGNVMNLIQGNSIGAYLGTSAPNLGNGINITIQAPTTAPAIALPLNDTIGGTAAGGGNVIANNKGAGIVVHDNYPTGITGLSIRGNVIFNNAKLGIDLNGTGVTTPSTLFVTAAGVVGSQLSVVGVYYGAPSTTYSIDVFANGTDPSGFGQAPIYLGSQSVTTNSAGFALFNPSFTPPSTPDTSYTATSTDPEGTTSEFSANFPGSTTGVRADLSLTTSTTTSTVVVGSTVTITETITNNGPNAANNVVLTDTLPTSLVNGTASASAGTATLVSNLLQASISLLASGQSATVTITATASQQGVFVDAPGVSSTTFDPNYDNNQAALTLVVTPTSNPSGADLAITSLTSTPTGTVGSNLVYGLTITNKGPLTATNVTVNDFLPPGVTLVGVVPSQGSPAVVNGTLITDNLGTIAAGGSATILVIETPTAAGSIVNAANVSGNQTDPVRSNNSTSLTTAILGTIPKINLTLSQAASPSPGVVGQFEVFTVTVTNTGPDAATNVTLVDTLPSTSAATLVNIVPSQGGSPGFVNGFLVENFGTVAAGKSATLTLVMTPNVTGLLTNGAGVYTPDVPSAPSAFATGVVPIFNGPSVTAVDGLGNNSKLVVGFNEALNPATATTKANYKLVALGKNGNVVGKTIAITGASYNSTTHAVTLSLGSSLDPTQYYSLTVIGSTATGIVDTQGRKLVSPLSGVPGTDDTTIFFAGTLPQLG